MKKIGILTFHSAYNYGAFLQCYSLYTLIKNKFPNCSVEVIDYKSGKIEDYYSGNLYRRISSQFSSSGQSRFLRAKIILAEMAKEFYDRKELKFNKKRNFSIHTGLNYLNLSEKHIVGRRLSDLNQIIDRQYDIIVVGSDAVWNGKQVESPNVYTLGGCSASIVKMSYSASAYGLEYRELNKDDLNYFKSSLMTYRYIGVRDVETENFIRYAGVAKEICHNCDPSLFLDLKCLPVSVEDVKAKFIAKGVDLSKPIIGIMGNEWLAAEVKKHLGSSYQYIGVYKYNKACDYLIDNLTPFEWAVAFSLFSATFTHFFHGTMFSLKNGTLTYSIENNTSYLSSYRTKIQDALGRMNLLDRYHIINDLNDAVWKDIQNEVAKGPSLEYKCRVLNGIELEAKSVESFLSVLNQVIYEE